MAQDNSNLYMVMDLALGGDLRYQLKQCVKKSDKEKKKSSTSNSVICLFTVMLLCDSAVAVCADIELCVPERCQGTNGIFMEFDQVQSNGHNVYTLVNVLFVFVVSFDQVLQRANVLGVGLFAPKQHSASGHKTGECAVNRKRIR